MDQTQKVLQSLPEALPLPSTFPETFEAENSIDNLSAGTTIDNARASVSLTKPISLDTENLENRLLLNAARQSTRIQETIPLPTPQTSLSRNSEALGLPNDLAVGIENECS